MMVYNRALTDAEIGHLAGNVFLDLSGNKYNAVALGTGFEMNSTTDAGSVNNSFSQILLKRFLLMGIIHLVISI